jgi:hypothetical protein
VADPFPSGSFLRAFVLHLGGGVPAGMEGEDQPILIVDEARIDFIFHVVRLAAELRTYVRNLHRVASLIFSFVSDTVGFGLPDPAPREFESRTVYAEGVADRINLPP